MPRVWPKLVEAEMFLRAQPPPAAWQRLVSQMGGLVKGCSLDLVTWLVFCLNCDRDEGRDFVAELVSRYCNLSDLDPWLRCIEEREKVKSIGPRSLTCGYAERPPYEGAQSMEDGVLKYMRKHDTHLNPDALRAARSALFALLAKASLRLMSVVDAAFDFKKRSNCGWPWFVSSVVSPLEYLNEAESILQEGCDHLHCSAYPGSLGTRTDIRGRGLIGKSRVIYGISRVTNILNGMLFGPTYAALWEKENFVAWVSRAAVDRVVSRVMRSRRVMYSIDFSGFDASVPNEIIDVVFDAFAYWFKPGSAVLIEFLRNSFKYTGLYVPGKVEYYHGLNRMGGIPSGSKLTNLVGGLANFVIMHYCAARAKCQVIDLLIQGDDGLVTFDGGMTKEKLAYYIERDCGMRLSVEKTLVDRDSCAFLQMHYHRSYRIGRIHPGVRSIMRSIGRMMSREHSPPPPPEGWAVTHPDTDWQLLMEAFRAIQQVDHCSGHPCFRLFATWVAEHVPCVEEAVRAVLRNDVSLLTKVESIIRGDPSKSKLTDMYKAPVVAYLAASRSWS